MRRRVVCPRSHPASLYLRRLSGAFAKGSQSPPGGRPPGTPRWVPGHASRPLAAQALVGAPRGPEGRFGSPEPVSCGHRPAPIPLPLLPLAGSGEPRHLRCPDNTVGSSHARGAGVPWPDGRWNLQPVASVLRIRRGDGLRLPGRGVLSAPRPSSGRRRHRSRLRRAGAQRAVGQLGTEFCPCPANPPAAPSPPRRRVANPHHGAGLEATPEAPYPACVPPFKGIDYFPRGL